MKSEVQANIGLYICLHFSCLRIIMQTAETRIVAVVVGLVVSSCSPCKFDGTVNCLDACRYSYLYSAYKSKESLGASVAKKMCFQRLSKRIEGESRPLKPGWKVIPQSRTGSRETPIAEFVVSSWDEQLPDVIGMGSQRATTSIRQKMTVVSEIRGSSTSERGALAEKYSQVWLTPSVG